jgi:hypothetical protein
LVFKPAVFHDVRTAASSLHAPAFAEALSIRTDVRSGVRIQSEVRGQLEIGNGVFPQIVADQTTDAADYRRFSSEEGDRFGDKDGAILGDSSSHIILQTETPEHHRLSVPDHQPLRLGTLNAIQRAVARANRVTREAILASL